MSRWKLCKGCDQPMLPKGRKKKPGEFDHARGCPLDKTQRGRVARTLDIRIIDHLPIEKKTGMGRKVCRRMVSANIEDIRLPSNRQMQHVAFEVKMALSRANQRTAHRRRR